MAVESRQLPGALNCWRLAKWSRICRLLCLCQDAGGPGCFLFLRESTRAELGGGQQPLAAPVLLPAPLCWVAAAAASPDLGPSPGWSGQLCPFPVASRCSRILAWLSWAPYSWMADGVVTSLLPSTVLAVTLPSSGRGDADPSAHRALLHGGLLPCWGDAGPSPLLLAPLCPPVSPRGAAVAAYVLFFIFWQGPTPCLSLAISEGCWWLLNCLKLIKTSWVGILNRTFVASVKL